MKVSSALMRLLLRVTRPHPESVLQTLNEARAVLGIPLLDELPRGMTAQFANCPLARALPGVVGVDGIAFALPDQALAVANVWGTSVELSDAGVFVARMPQSLRRFVQDFDLGAYPELREDPASRAASNQKESAADRPGRASRTLTADRRRAA